MSLVAMLGKPSKGNVVVKDEDLKRLLAKTEGGKGSGNFGHAGRPGEVGGSAPGDSGGAEPREIPYTAKDFQTIEGDAAFGTPSLSRTEDDAMKFGVEKINTGGTSTRLRDDKRIYNSVYDYMDTAYRQVNKYLRKDEMPTGYNKSFMDDMIDGLDAACENEIGEDVVVYRSMKPTDLDIGDEFVDKGYVSTSLDKNVAATFRHGILARIYVPKGSKGVFLGHVPVGMNRNEWEVLLARQTKFRVLNKVGNRIELEVVNE